MSEWANTWSTRITRCCSVLLGVRLQNSSLSQWHLCSSLCWNTKEQVLNPPDHAQAAGTSPKQKIIIIINEWAVLSPGNTFLKPSSCLCAWIPALRLQEGLWGSSHPAPLPTQTPCSSCPLLSLFRDCAKHNCTLFPLVTLKPVVYHNWTRGWKYYTFENSLETASLCFVLLFFFLISLNRAPFVCSVGYPAPNHTST